MNDSRSCIDCQYESKWGLSTYRCNTCMAVIEKPNFKPKLEETMKNEDTKPTFGRTFDYDEIVPAAGSRKTAEQEETMSEEKSTRYGCSNARQESATDAIAKIMDYSHPLYEAFDDAVKQATKGKGERHGGDKTPFMEQPWHQIAKHTNVGGLIFQMVKKAQEACGKDDQEAFERELLGALVYGGAAYLYVKKHGFKK